MICPIVPQGLLGEQAGLLTALLIGFGFGFSLERAGFGNARKLAAQFYLYDWSVFKVMFTAVLVAMVGILAFTAFGWCDLSLLWINPTFLWPQLVGGLLVGVGFMLSGLCPGTAVVSFASGRLDGLLTFLGVFAGTFAFTVMMDKLPGLQAFYSAGAQGRSLLPALLGLPAPWLALIILVVALGGFLGAEKLEARFQKRYGQPPLTPTGGAQVKFILVGAMALVVIAAGFAPEIRREFPAPVARALEAQTLAEAIIAGDPNLLILDLREDSEASIPGARSVSLGSEAEAYLGSAAPGSTVLFVDGTGQLPDLPEHWSADLQYRYLRGGYAAWEAEVLTPREATGGDLAEREAARRQNEMAAYFTGSENQVKISAPPPPAPSGGKKKKKADGGC